MKNIIFIITLLLIFSTISYSKEYYTETPSIIFGYNYFNNKYIDEYKINKNGIYLELLLPINLPFLSYYCSIEGGYHNKLKEQNIEYFSIFLKGSISIGKNILIKKVFEIIPLIGVGIDHFSIQRYSNIENKFFMSRYSYWFYFNSSIIIRFHLKNYLPGIKVNYEYQLNRKNTYNLKIGVIIFGFKYKPKDR